MHLAKGLEIFRPAGLVVPNSEQNKLCPVKTCSGYPDGVSSPKRFSCIGCVMENMYRSYNRVGVCRPAIFEKTTNKHIHNVNLLTVGGGSHPDSVQVYYIMNEHAAVRLVQTCDIVNVHSQGL